MMERHNFCSPSIQRRQRKLTLPPFCPPIMRTKAFVRYPPLPEEKKTLKPRNNGRHHTVLKIQKWHLIVYLICLWPIPYFSVIRKVDDDFPGGASSAIQPTSKLGRLMDSRLTEKARIFVAKPSNTNGLRLSTTNTKREVVAPISHDDTVLASPTKKTVPKSDMSLAAPTTKGKPLLVLHVGPAKTATTSLQYMLQKYQPLLLEDSYHYVGSNSTELSNPFDGRCLRRLKKGDTSCWSEFTTELENHRQAGHNILLSNEVISLQAQNNEVAWDLLQAAIKPWLPNVKVVVGYRHLHNFLPSTHFELQRNQRWPSQNEHGKPVTPFVKFYEEFFHREELLSGPIPSPAATIRKYGAHYNVTVVNIENTEQVSEFVCHILPDAMRTCQHHKEKAPLIPSLNRNDGGQVNYDALSIYAFQNQMFKKEQTRKYVRARVKYENEMKMNRNSNHFPLDCLSQEQENELLQLSLRHASESGLSDYEDAIRKDFVKAKGKQKFCSINATLAFELPEWKRFFEGAKESW